MFREWKGNNWNGYTFVCYLLLFSLSVTSLNKLRITILIYIISDGHYPTKYTIKLLIGRKWSYDPFIKNVKQDFWNHFLIQIHFSVTSGTNKLMIDIENFNNIRSKEIS